MYSRYSQVSKSSPQKKMQYRSKGKSCGYYMRIVFFFSSLIQSLIIVSLVLFLVYGKTQDSASTTRIQDLEESFSRLSIENVALRLQRKNLTNLLNTTLTEKARNDWDLVKLRHFSNISLILIQDFDKKLQQCNIEWFSCKNTARCPTTFQVTDTCNCGLLTERLKAKLDLVESNFTQTTQRLRMEMDQTAKEKDTISLEAIRLRRDKSTHEKEVEFFRQKCKDDFAQSLSGISNVSKAFLEKISSLFPTHIAFQLTCPKQRDHLEQIRTNCSSLSMEVEDKFQRYLDSVGGQVSAIQAESSHLKAENWRLSDDYRWCTTNRTGLMLQHGQNLAKLQRKHDEDKERLLIDKMRLNEDLKVLRLDVKFKSKEVDHLTEQIKQLNLSCVPKTGYSGFPSRSGTQPQPGWGLGGGSSSASSSSSFGVQPGRAGSGGLSSSSGSFPSTFNKPVSNGAGSSSSSVLSSGSGSSTGSGFNRPGQGSIGTGSSSSSVSSTGSGSSIGSAFNKPGSNGAGSSSSSVLSSGSGSSTGSGFNRPGQGSVGAGSSSSSVLSSGSGSSTGSGFNRLGQGSIGAGSSSSSVLSPGSGSSTGAGFNTGGGHPNIGSASNPILSPSGTGSNNPAQSGRGSPTFGSSSGSSGTGLNKPASGSSLGSSSGSSAGATGATSKSGPISNPFSWLGIGNSGQSKSGSGTGKAPSTGNSYGGTGSSFGAGRTSGLGGGSVSVAQHVKDLQRIINPSGPEEKQDLSRVLG